MSESRLRGCGFRANFQDVRQIDYTEALKLTFADRYDQRDMTSRSDGYELHLSRPCTLHEFIKAFIEQCPKWDYHYGARICTKGNDIRFDKVLDDTCTDFAIFNQKCKAVNGYGWSIYGLDLQHRGVFAEQ